MPRSRVDEATFSKASVVTIRSLDGYLKPVTVYGKSTQASTPTPDVPVPIVSTTGNQTVKSVAKNIFDAGVGITSGFYYDASGTALVSAPDFIQTAYIPVLPNTTYTMSHAGSATPKIVQYTSGQAFISRAFAIGATSVTVTTGATTAFIRLSSATSQLATTQLELGSVATAFVPHNVSTQTLPLGSTQLRSLPNGVSDRIYKDGSTWKLEQNVGTQVITGAEYWVFDAGYGGTDGSSRYKMSTTVLYDRRSFVSTTMMSERFTPGAPDTSGRLDGRITVNNGASAARLIFINTLTYINDITGFKAWIAANPFVFQIQLETPVTTVLDPIANATLITALENIRTYQGITNITATTPVSGVYLPNSLRTAATNRVAVQDMKASLDLGATGSVLAATIPALDLGCTFSAWFNTNLINANAKTIVENSITANKRIVMMMLGSTLRAGFYNGTAYTSKSSTSLNSNTWYHGVFTWDGSATQVYINGIVQNGADAPQSSAGGGLGIGRRGDGATSRWLGKLAEVTLWNRALTPGEALSVYTTGVTPAGVVGRYKLNEGAGTTAYDTSGNNNHGTITAGTYTADVPTKKRELVGGNMVKNGDFEFAPPFVAATTTTGKWIDGTGSGAMTNSLFGWLLAVDAGTVAASYDAGALKLSLSAVGSSLYVTNFTGAIATSTASIIAAKPSTSYTYIFKMKTTRVSGSAMGAYLEINGRSASGVLGAALSTTAINTTTPWTEYTGTFTTGVSDVYIGLRARLKGNNGTNDLIMDAWFDDITLTPTTNTTRTAV